MQKIKEDFIEFLKTIKKEVHEWESRHLWASRIFVYSLLLLLVIFVGAILFANFNLFHTDVTSARYMLSALVQSQAAIVAIVITLTLIAVQLTASAYSPRVIDIFKKNPDMWILLGCYGVSIFYGFIILKLVEGAEGEFVSQSAIWCLGPISISFEFFVSLAYWLGAFTFLILVPYMWNIMDLLKPESIIKRLATKITKDKILDMEEDPIQPIMDIIHGSIMKYDLETTRVGLKAVTDRVIKIIETEIIDSDSEKEISGHFCKHLERVGRLAISKLDEESAIEVIENLENFGKSSAGKGLEDAATEAAGSLSEVGMTAAKKKFETATSQAAVSLGSIGITVMERELKVAAFGTARALGEVGRAAAKEEFETAIFAAATFLEAVGEAAAEKGFELAAQETARSLVMVGINSVEKGLESATATRQVIISLAELAILSEEIVKTPIQDIESGLKEKDSDSFQKFMKIYKQELEEPRAKNKNPNKKTERR